MASLQAIRLRQVDRGLRAARRAAALHPGLHGEDHYWHDDDGDVRDVTCRICSGTGGDPWNDGITPCEHCDGEGYAWWN